MTVHASPLAMQFIRKKTVRASNMGLQIHFFSNLCKELIRAKRGFLTEFLGIRAI